MLVYISDSPECLNDQSIGSEIYHFLSDNLGANVVTLRKAGRTVLDLPDSKWIIFIISPESLKSDRVMEFCCLARLHDGTVRNTVNIIPVLINVDICELPDFIKWITFVQVATGTSNDDLKYTKENLLRIIKGSKMMSSI